MQTITVDATTRLATADPPAYHPEVDTSRGDAVREEGGQLPGVRQGGRDDDDAAVARTPQVPPHVHTAWHHTLPPLLIGPVRS